MAPQTGGMDSHENRSPEVEPVRLWIPAGLALFIALAVFVLDVTAIRAHFRVGLPHFSVYAAFLSVLTAASLLGAWLMARGRVLSGTRILLAAHLVIYVAMPPYYLYQGWVEALAILILVLCYASLTLPPREGGRYLIIALLAAGAVVARDNFSQQDRPAIPAVSMSLWPLGIALGLIGAMFLVRSLRNYGLVTRFVVAFAIVALVPMVALFAINLRMTKVSLTRSAEASLGHAAGEARTLIRGFFDRADARILDTAVNPVYSEFLVTLSRERGELVNSRLRAMVEGSDHIYSAGLIDLDGVIVAHSDPERIGTSRADDPVFQIGRTASRSAYISPVIFTPDSGMDGRIRVSAPVYDEDSQKLVGVVFHTYSADLLQDMVRDMTNMAGLGSYAALYDENMICIAHGRRESERFRLVGETSDEHLRELIDVGCRLPPLDPAELRRPNPALVRALEGSAQKSIVSGPLGINSEPTAAVVLSMETPPWHIVFARPESAYLSILQEGRRNHVVTGIIILIAVVIAGAIVAQFLTGPIYHLIEVMSRVMEGDLTARARVESVNETGALALAFNRMTDHLGATMESLEERYNEAQRAQRMLRDSEGRIRSLLDNINDGIYEIDLDGRITYANPAMLRLLEVGNPAEVLGTAYLDLLDSESAAKVREANEAVRTTRRARRGLEYEITSRGGRLRHVEDSISLVQDMDQSRPRGFQGLVRDITERRQAMEALAAQKRELEVTNETLLRRNAELDEFTFLSSHDMQEPLRKLCAFSGILRKDLGEELTDRIRRDIDFIEDSAVRMRDLVQDLLQLSSANRVHLRHEVVSSNKCVDDALAHIRQRDGLDNVEIVRGDLPEIRADREVLSHIFLQLISNAIKFSDKKAPRVEITAERIGPDHVLGVRDNGIGIKPEYIEKIFAPFRRLHGRSKFRGSGIGLTICRKYADRCNGRIWVESVVGEGSHFKFYLREPTNDVAPEIDEER